ncbi:MAG: hypothetical protein ACR2LF_02890 [Jatrophihabitantaceae bacterium]
MRTTLTLDDDVAAALERRRVGRGTRLREEVNDLLRAGLAAVDRPSTSPDRYELPAFDPGRPLITDSRVLSELLDAEDVERATPARS